MTDRQIADEHLNLSIARVLSGPEIDHGTVITGIQARGILDLIEAARQELARRASEPDWKARAEEAEAERDAPRAKVREWANDLDHAYPQGVVGLAADMRDHAGEGVTLVAPMPGRYMVNGELIELKEGEAVQVTPVNAGEFFSDTTDQSSVPSSGKASGTRPPEVPAPSPDAALLDDLDTLIKAIGQDIEEWEPLLKTARKTLAAAKAREAGKDEGHE